jgi:hypothetical protein
MAPNTGAITISTLIKQLTRLKNTHGDLSIMIGDHFSGYNKVTKDSLSLRRLSGEKVNRVHPPCFTGSGDIYLTLNQTVLLFGQEEPSATKGKYKRKKK